MKKLVRISALLLLYCLSTAKNCTGPEEEKAANQVMVSRDCDSIKSVISSDTISEEMLRAFEESARQKIFDFSDYAGFLSDTSLDPAFRDKAETMIKGLFLKDSVCIPDYIHKHPQFDSVGVLLPLHRISKICYSGKLGCPDATADKEARSGKFPSQRVLSVDIYLIKHATLMGRDSIHSWKIFLGKFH